MAPCLLVTKSSPPSGGAQKKKTPDKTKAKDKTEAMNSFLIYELRSAKETGVGRCLGGN